MSFSSLIFIYFFLPLVLLGYYLIPHKGRNLFLLAANLVFYGWGEPSFVPVIVGTALVNWAAGLALARFAGQKRTRTLIFAGAMALDLGLLFVFKYADFCLKTMGIGKQLGLALPLGISFYTFQVVSYLIDVWRQTVPPEKSLTRFAAYLTFFPQLIAGPIVRYDTLRFQLAARQESTHGAVRGIQYIAVGLAKKVLLANQIALLFDTVRGNLAASGSLGAWAGALAFTFQIYFDFSGYSDMARGLGLLFGFDLPENFHYPYCAQSITAFWRRWHITLSSWFRDYVYIPLGGSRRGNVFGNLFIVWALTGLWHGAAWNFVLWGIYYFALLSVEKCVGEERLACIPKPIRHLYTLLGIVVGWVLFAVEDFGALGAYLKTMFSGAAMGQEMQVTLLAYLPLLLVCAVASTPLAAKLWARGKSSAWADGVALVLCLAVLLFCTAAFVADSYNPFLYFRF